MILPQRRIAIKDPCIRIIISATLKEELVQQFSEINQECKII